jgi:predicted permease
LSSRLVLWVRDLAVDGRYALRTCRRQPAFALVAVMSLAVGIGLNTAVFSVINTIFLQSVRGVPHPERVVTLGGRVPFTTFRDVRDNSRTLTGVAAWQPIAVNIRFRGTTLRDVVPAVSEEYFTVLGIRPARGRFFDAISTRQPAPVAEAVLDYEFWMETLGGDPTIIGDTIGISGIPATILGVAPQAFHGFGPERPPLWIRMGMTPAVRSHAPRWEDPGESGWRIAGRLSDETTVGQVDAELRTLAARSPSLFPDGALRASTGRERWSGPVSPEKQIEFLLVVVLPLVVVGLILWIGCSNVANLLMARATTRRREIAIRLANGARRTRLLRMLLTESLLLAAAGGALGLLFAAWTLDFVWATLPGLPRLAVELDVRVLMYTAAVSAAATLLFGMVPALHATRVDVAPLLKGEESGHAQIGRGARVRTFFLVTQFASSMALLIVAGTFVRTLIDTHLGERSILIDHLTLGYMEATADSSARRVEYWTMVREEILRVPSVTAVTLMPAGSNRQSRLVPEGTDPTTHRSHINVQAVDASYFRTAGLALIAGRDDLPGGPGSPVERAVINERAARRYWGTSEVVGKRFSLDGGANTEIVGVVRDDGSEPRVFRRLSDADLTNASVFIRTSLPSATMVEPLRVLLVRLSSDRTFTRVSTLREASTGGLEGMTRMALAIGAVVLALATVGLYGSVSFVTSQRTREIAIRLAVGAPRPAVLKLLAREGVLVVAAGSAFGLVLTAIAFRFMAGMIFARWTLDPITVAGVLSMFAIATLAACYLPGRRAMRIDPMNVLRSE